MGYAIQNMDGKHLGFLLFAGNEKEGDCIFRSLPSEADQFESPEAELLLNLQNSGEFQYAVKSGITNIHNPNNTELIVISGSTLNIGNVKLKVVKLENS